MSADKRDAVLRLARETGLGRASIAVRTLAASGASAATVDLDSARAIYPASMLKTPIAMVLARQISAGIRRREDTTVIASENMTANDAPSPLAPGYRTTIGDLADRMVARSDNVATNVLIDVLGRETLTAGCHELGLGRTSVHRKLSGSLPLIDDPAATGRNSHPACDAARAFELISAESRDGFAWVYDALRAQIWNGKLSPGFDASDVFAHKTGDTDEQSHDGGILSLPDGRRFIIVVYTEAGADPHSDAAFTAFACGLRVLLADPDLHSSPVGVPASDGRIGPGHNTTGSKQSNP
ncbi:MAG: class A beta-lactamase-related serine hydrolase [Candidatus Eremiobacteraeota bacterium]|nr:class A beta-lactamase-related serine hydrolase [Candidatus Eremiobacteraeota bacterium]